MVHFSMPCVRYLIIIMLQVTPALILVVHCSINVTPPEIEEHTPNIRMFRNYAGAVRM
jgi:hypothetical protein